MPLNPGSYLGRYEVVGLIGAGGMGEVYRAHDRSLGRDVAIKVLPEDMSRDEGRLRRFEQEARAAAALNHPAILGVHDFGVHHGRTYLVTELLDGESLGTVLLDGPLPIGRALEYAVQVARGLAAAHAKGVLHRDLKPANVFLTRDGHVKILDFGLAKLTDMKDIGPDARSAIGATATGALAGTPGYMAPEQIRSGSADARSDLFALGAVLYEMVSGNQAFGGVSAGDRVAAVLRDEPSTLEMRVGAIPRSVDRIFRRCLKKDPADRFQNAEDLVAALEAAIKEPHEAPYARRRVVASALGVLALAALAFVADRITHHGERLSEARRPAAAGASRALQSSIAVLPFESPRGEQSEAWLADGVTTDVITRLSAIRGLERVIGWESAKQLKDTSKPPSEIAKSLNVAVVVTGSLRSTGEHVQLTVRLHAPDADAPVWEHTFERSANEMPLLQRDVVRGVLDRMGVELTPQEQARLADTRGVDFAAYAERFRGRAACYEGTPAAFQEGFAHYQRAVELDPTFAAAWAGYAECYAIFGLSGLDRPVAVFPKAKAAALRAVELDEFSADALAALGQARLLWDWDPVAAEQDLRRSVALGPNSLPAHIQYAYFLIAVGRYDEGLAEAARAQELDPIDFGALLLAGWSGISAQRFDGAIVALKRALEMAPDAPFPHAQLAYAYARTGRRAEALAEFETTQRMSPPGAVLFFDTWLAPVYRLAGKRSEGLRLADAWAERARTTYVDGYALGAFYFRLGKTDNAIAWLQRAYDDHSSSMVNLENDEWFTGLRADPRVQDLIRKVRPRDQPSAGRSQ